ncbi:MAG: hydroxymethylbilane synthase [candidate division Zixibacteria bacterium]
MNRKKLILGSRGSDLALYQANFVANLLESELDCPAGIKIIKTSGDKLQELSFDKMEGKGFFTKELEDALLAREIDLAVHSLKDLMTSMPDGLKLGTVGYRADRCEMLLSTKDAYEQGTLVPVRSGSVIGTSSTRRKCQLAHHAPTLEIKDLRGNVPTRVSKLREGLYDAIIVAAAGVTRLELDLSDLKVTLLDPEKFLPAPAQGILGIQIRSNDSDVESVISRLGSKSDALAANLERGLLARFDAGCSLPLGVFSDISGDSLRLKAVLGQREGDTWTGLTEIQVTGTDPETMVDEAFARLCGEKA